MGQIAGTFPARAVAAIPTGCTLLNEYMYGGFVIFRRWPEVRVSLDGRNDVYGFDRIREQHLLLESRDPDRVDALGARCVLLHRRLPLARALAADPRWRRLSEDGAFLLFERIGPAGRPATFR